MGDCRQIVMMYPNIAEHAAEKVAGVLRDRWVGQGALVTEFEMRFGELVGRRCCVAVNSQSAALRLALAIVGVGPGDEVITTPQTCTATNQAILEQGALPVFADIQYLTGNINPADIEPRITERSRAIVCMHWGGYPCDLAELHEIAARYQLPVIEDASEAMGASYRGVPIGAVSHFTTFSFNAVQIFTTGEGGMLCTRDERHYEAALRRRWFGIDRAHRVADGRGYYDFDIRENGYGYHLTNVAAAIGLAALDCVEVWFKGRANLAEAYRQGLRNVPGVTLFERRPDRICANQLFTVHVERRADFCAMMRSKGIETSIVHDRNDRYTIFGGRRTDLPELGRFEKTHISLPIHNKLTGDDQSYILDEIRSGW